jgi:polysaccharide biosynthesis transport protein
MGAEAIRRSRLSASRLKSHISEAKMNQEHDLQQPGAAFTVSDVMYTLFRHKWKIVLFSFLGVGAAAAAWFLKAPLFESEAKILVRFVTERRAVASGPGDSDVVREPETRGMAVINSEVEILTSADCILDAVRAIGSEKILAAYGGGTNIYQAAGLLRKQLTPKVGASGVVTVELGHRDGEIAREALTRIIEAYRRKHVQIHHASEAYDDLQAEADRIRNRLTSTEAQLKTVKGQAKVISLEDAKVDISVQLSSLRSSIFAGEAELAELRAELELAEKRFGLVSSASTNQPGGSEAPLEEYPVEKLEEYRDLSAKLNFLKNREDELLLANHTETSRAVMQLRQQITDTQSAIAALGIDPKKLPVALPKSDPSGAPALTPENELLTLRTRVHGLEARVEQLRKQRIEIQEHFAAIESSENKILELERLRRADEDKLRQYESNLDKARLDQAIDSNKITNISVVQEPTPAGRDMLKLYKLMAGAFCGMVGAGVALGFVIDMFLDGSLKRAKDVENKSRVPLFVSIPYLGKSVRTPRKLRKRAVDGNGSGLVRHGEIAPWDMSDPMFEYYEAIRDRLVMSYEGDPHKPKMVAVTSCNKGAGTSRISTGLAAALSRDVQRHVLYIGLEKNKVAVTSFFKGRPGPGTSEIENAQIENAPMADEVLPADLCTLARVGHGPGGASIVQTFCDMIPKLRMSEYDYIIFDLPPVSETSGALRLASQMERTLLVIESEETQKAKVDRVRDLLAESQSRLFGVLNKTKTYGPQFLQQDS